MAGALRVTAAGPGATVQDGGRHLYLRYGVTPAGPMDWVAFRTANLAAGNDAEAAALEISVGGLDLLCEEAPLAVAICGGAFLWRREGREVPAACCLVLQPGEHLTVRAGAYGAWCYLAVAGGFATPPEMGSRATHTRSGIGGLEGRMLRAGDLLPIGAALAPGIETYIEARIEAPWLAQPSPLERPLRVVPGPQDDYFSDAGLATFFEAEFELTPMADRMAYRLDGPVVMHSRGFNIVSDGIALGAIQIAGDGRPLVLMADRQPTGGYPKIGHIARADIGRIAQMRPGARCRFARVGVAEARAALLALEDEIMMTRAFLRPLQAELSSERLLAANLVDGFIDALA